MGPHYLDCLFSPQGIAVFGASEQSHAVGSVVFENLVNNGFKGLLYPINPKHKEIQGHRCYPHIDEVPPAVDLALIATPADTVSKIIHQCGEHGIQAAIIFSAGFAEGQATGKHLQKAVLDEAKKYGIRLLGPNCLGLIRAPSHVNATFSKNSALPGSLALVSQSGALCTAILDWAEPRNIGFSAVISLGSAVDIDFGDVLDYLALDPHTKSILLYVEGVHNTRLFMSSLRVAARMKPVVVLKVGRHAAGSRAAISHTGALVGTDDVFDAALRRAGVVRAMTVDQLFAAAQLLATPHRVQGKRLTIITNGGGPGVMATDRAVDIGLEVTQLSDHTISQLNKMLPPHWSGANPVDIIGDATPSRFKAALEICLQDSNTDGILVMLTPQAMTEPLQAAQAVIDAASDHKMPVLTCWMGENHVKAAWNLFAQNKIPVFSTPEASVEAFAYLSNYHHNQQLLMQVPGPLAKPSEPDVAGAQLIINSILSEGRKTLNELESKALLAAFNIPLIQSVKASSSSEALVAAESIGYPVVMKINSPDVTHKSEVNGIRLNITHAEAIPGTFHELNSSVKNKNPNIKIDGVTIEKMYQNPYGRELLVGAFRDPMFGPIISFGSGGTAVEIIRDRSVALPPLNDFIAHNMIKSTRAAKWLDEFRGMPAANLYKIIQVLVRVSEMVCELPNIKELDINPLMASPQGVVAVDARIVVDSLAPGLDRYRHMAIHPYPSNLVTHWHLADGTSVISRPIRPEDAKIEQEFVRNLSPQAKYFRFMQALHELTTEMLVRFTQIDYDREMAFIAVVKQAGDEVEIGVARYFTNPDGNSCEFAIVIADEWRKKGIGSRLMKQLIQAARNRGFNTIEGEILADNRPMIMLMRHLGFRIQTHESDPVLVIASKTL